MTEPQTSTEARLDDLEAAIRNLAQMLKRNGELIEQLIAKVDSNQDTKP